MGTQPQLAGADITKLFGIFDEMKKQYDNVREENKKFGQASADTTTKLKMLDEALVKLHADVEEKHTKRVESLETQIKDLLEARAAKPKSIGDRIVEEKGFIEYLKSAGSGNYAFRIADANIWSAPKKDITGTGVMVPQQLPGISMGPQLPVGVRTVVPQGRTTAGAISYLRETAFTNNAAVVAEAAAKPKSDKTLVPVTAVVRTIAHLFKVSKQSYDDTPGLAALIDNNGLYGVQLAEDDELLNGSGVAPHLTGFNTIAVAAPAPPAVGTGEPANNLVDALGYAVFDLAAKGFLPDGLVVNQADWGKVALLKNAQGNYLFSNPIDYSPIGRVWGARQVFSAKQAAGTFLAGAFRGNSLLLDREEVSIQVATQNVDDFEKNMLTILIEERLLLLIQNIGAFEKGVVPAAA